MTPGTVAPKKVWFAQALRAPACLLVVVSHLLVIYPRAHRIDVPWDGFIDFLRGADIDLGQVGVGVFFLISGFVIPYSVTATRPGAFTVRRFFRIYPTMWVCLLVTLLALRAQTIWTGSPGAIGGDVIASNAALIGQYLGHPLIEPALWTLAIEEIFYVIAATLSWRRVLDNPLWLLVVGFVTAATTLPVLTPSNAAPYWFVSNLRYIPLMLIGTAAHYVWEKRWRLREGVLMTEVLFAAFLFSVYGGPNADTAKSTAMSSVIALAVFGLAFYAGPKLRFSRATDAVSEISYPLYLLHATNGAFLLLWMDRAGWSYLVALPVAIAVVVAVSVLVHRAVELPAQVFGRRVGAALAARQRLHQHDLVVGGDRA